MTPVERLLAKLPSAKRNGRGWIARCPAHDDRRPSLSIAEGEDGRALVHCHADCTLEAICAVLCVDKTELFTDRGDSQRSRVRRESPRPTPYATAHEAIAALERGRGRRSTDWTYHDARGEPVGLVLRWDGPNGKEIRPVSRKGSSWFITAMPPPRPLYGLPDLIDARRVYVTEGEKAADAARSIGLTATTSAGGANAARKTDWRILAGRECVLLPDHDDAGHAYGETVLALLSELSPLPLVKVVQLSGLPAGGDIVDFIAAVGGGDV